MSMKIKGSSGHPIATSDGGQTKAAERPQSNSADPIGKSSGGSNDTVSITVSATRLRELEAQIASLPIADAQHISDIQRSLASGNFAFEPEDAAENLLTQEREFANITKKE
ncbi:MAG: flagellar biosynthesis anti-sigma factor FlgM [Sedimenticola selenatireducens]|uniref:Negative regulator of flagellin synthesis n=2 Tax=Sedimenticola selenatireducens TaxID=191960 RepID=A0A558E0J8_9GAMM|nr:flagellar biosynthesis anti-sigma factor FlgM [Sedimenticola selenatireducens]TVT66876.1 MAG: flagellar biosynthesis anti-sigma factor FlgM [Sedimenticola selenatireducens]